MSAAVQVPAWLLALMIVALCVFALILWGVKRRRRPRFSIPDDTDTGDLIFSIAGITSGTVVGDNRVTLIQNGAFWDQVFEDLEHAKRTINFETFLTKEGELTRRLVELTSKFLQRHKWPYPRYTGHPNPEV